jgi:hypothetical protein
MVKTFKEYLERMGLYPTYGTPEQIDEDDEFKYYLFKVPRHYIREHIREGGTWLEYEETSEEGTLDKSVVLGMRYLPVYVGIKSEGFDVDFYYYKCRVPKVVLNAAVVSTNPVVTYEYVYSTVEEWEKSEEQKFEEELGKTFSELNVLKAGTEMPDRADLTAVRKLKKEKVVLFEVQLRCGSPECGMEQEPHVTSDFFDALYEQECSLCGCRRMELVYSKGVVKEDTNGRED